MCTGFVKRGDDVICGYNLDMGVGVWDYKVYAKKDMFYVGIRIGSRIYKTHGVNANGNFGNLPYMNGPAADTYRRGRTQRIDLLTDSYISARLTYGQLLATVRERETVNVPNVSMHSLAADREGHMLLIEPGNGYREITDSYAVISNFPILAPPADFTLPWYGKERYDRAEKALAESGADFSAADGLRLLRELRQEGEWATRLSFVYSRNENAVHYALEPALDTVIRHAFTVGEQ